MDHTLFQSPNATTSGISLTIWLPELLAICFSNASWKDSKASSQIGTYLDQNEELKPSWCDYTFMGFRRFNPIRPLFQDALSINTSVICCTHLIWRQSYLLQLLLPTRPVKRQLQITLYHFGSGASHSRIRTAIRFGCSEGTVHLYVRRVATAILDHQDEYI